MGDSTVTTTTTTTTNDNDATSFALVTDDVATSNDATTRRGALLLAEALVAQHHETLCAAGARSSLDRFSCCLFFMHWSASAVARTTLAGASDTLVDGVGMASALGVALLRRCRDVGRAACALLAARQFDALLRLRRVARAATDVVVRHCGAVAMLATARDGESAARELARCGVALTREQVRRCLRRASR